MKGPRPRPAIDRLLSRVEKLDCWTWLGATNGGGYGVIGVGSAVDGSNRMKLTHRVAYEAFIGPIQEGFEIDHVCRNRLCCNPRHLRAVTPRENVLAPWSLSPSKANSEKTHCLRGHAFDESNTRRYQGKRRCRACGGIVKRAWRARVA